MRFRNRTEAGKQLAQKLLAYQDQPDGLILALPRGGVPVAFEVAQVLHLPLDVFIVRKLGVPGHEELALGAIAMGGVRVLNQSLIKSLQITQEDFNAVIKSEQQELERRQRLYRDDRPLPEIRDHTLILIDDGLATGATMQAAVRAIHQQGPARLIVGVPISSPETCAAFQDDVDEIVCAVTPEPFYAVGMWYEDFPQVSDEDVHNLLADAYSV